jgi:hypothetical protein
MLCRACHPAGGPPSAQGPAVTQQHSEQHSMSDVLKNPKTDDTGCAQHVARQTTNPAHQALQPHSARHRTACHVMSELLISRIRILHIVFGLACHKAGGPPRPRTPSNTGGKGLRSHSNEANTRQGGGQTNFYIPAWGTACSQPHHSIMHSTHGTMQAAGK